MRENSISMSKPDINEDDVNRVVSALRSGQLSIGPFVEEFEELARQYIGTRYAVAVANGTSGLHLCMRLAGVREGAEVITSPFSFVASANCILYERGTPVFVDIDPATGKGEGQYFAAAKIRWKADKKKGMSNVEIEDYATYPAKLVNVESNRARP